MTEKSLHWDGASIGDADLLTESAADGIGYRLGNEDYESPMVDLMFRALWNGDENRGVLPRWANTLAVTGVATPVQVDTGAAVVYGMPYRNTSAVNVAVPNPTTDTRYDYIVLRRDWDAQTIRITRIAGVEGGGVPSLTQSPAPSGSGIYDVPLAYLSITTGGVIAVTDAREYCTFGTGIADDGLATTNLTNESVDWSDRATRTCRLFFGGGDLEPALNAGRFTLASGSEVIISGTAGWNGAANEEGWQLTGSAYEGAYVSFQWPVNYASGNSLLYAWWVNNAAVADSFYIRSAIQAYRPYDDQWVYNGVYTASSVYINDAGAVSDVFRTGPIFTMNTDYIDTDAIYHCLVYWYNSAGTEDISLMGVELEYTGYT